MRFKAHQSFFIRKGWLSKGMKKVSENPAIFMPSCSKMAMDELGLGSNQVVALRYWLGVVGLMEKSSDGKSHCLTDLCELVMEKDPYVEEMGTLWALHCKLASDREEATSWYWFFNEMKAKSFSKSDLVEGIQKYVSQSQEDDGKAKKGKALSSIESDIDCILNTYISHERLGGRLVSPENVIDCPLGDLGILDVDSRQNRTFRKKPANQASLPALLVLYAIYEMVEHDKWDEHHAWCESFEIPLDELLSGKYSPGLLYNLDSIALLEKLYELENEGYLKINRTAGSDVVRIADPNMGSLTCLSKYYEMIG